MAKTKAYIIGVGPSSPEYVYPEAKKRIEEADIIIGWELDIAPVKELIKSKKVFLQEGNNYLTIPAKAAEEAKKNKETVALLKLGDPLVSPAGLDSLLETFSDFDIEIIPGISTVQLAAAKAKVTMDESVIIVFHPAADGSIDLENLSNKQSDMINSLNNGKNILILNDLEQMPHQTARYLMDKGISGDTDIMVCENLSLEDERVFKGTLGDVVDMDFSWQSVMVVKK
jgi:iron complex transport system substrate-binding protein